MMTNTERIDDGWQRCDVQRKRNGPSDEPWDTPVSRGNTWDEFCFQRTNVDRASKYEQIQSNALSVTPNVCSSRLTSVSWSTQSNAADWSRATRMIDWWLSIPAKMSPVILSSAVSVEWSLLYADWTASKFDDVDACGTNRINTSCSNILLIVFKLEMGR